MYILKTDLFIVFSTFEHLYLELEVTPEPVAIDDDGSVTLELSSNSAVLLEFPPTYVPVSSNLHDQYVANSKTPVLRWII